MLQSFVVVFREGFEAFLIVAMIIAYLRKTSQDELLPAVHWGILVSVVTSALLGFLLLQGASQPLWEGVIGCVAAFMVAGLVIQMWRLAPRLKADVENRLGRATRQKTGIAAYVAVFIFSVLMISREGMEMALLLIQIHDPKIVIGILTGIAAAVATAYVWVQWSHLINLKLFFQTTSVFLLLFVFQILIYSFHEFTEARIFPNSEAWHLATEPFSPVGRYGRWFSLIIVVVTLGWLLAGWLKHRFSRTTQYGN